MTIGGTTPHPDPTAIEAMRVILGSVLHFHDRFEQVADLSPEAIPHPALRAVKVGMDKVASKGVEITIESVAMELGPEFPDPESYLKILKDDVIPISNLRPYCERLQENFVANPENSAGTWTPPGILDNSGHSGHSGQQGTSSGRFGTIQQNHWTTSGQLPDTPRTLSGDVFAFIEMDPEPFTTNDVYSELCVKSRREKKTIHAALCYYEKQGKIRKIHGKRGHWEIAESEPEVMDLSGDDDGKVELPLPLDITNYCAVPAGSIILVAGGNNACKTLFLLSVVQSLVQNPTYTPTALDPSHLRERREGSTSKTLYLNSEMGRAELKSRIIHLGGDPAEWMRHVDFIERSHSFDRLIRPDAINLVDFLEIHEDFFAVGKMLADIHRKLRSGVALVALQKKQGSEFAKGGEMSLEKPRLAINLDKNEPHGFTCKITKLKQPVDFRRNIQGMTRDFVISADSMILPISDWRFVSEKQRAAINAEYARTNLPRRVMETGKHYRAL